jgi:hypothetical protein
MAGLHTAAAETRLPWEQQPRIVEDRFRLEFSSFMATLNTTARVDFSNEFPGTEFNAEDDFGLPGDKFVFLPELTLLRAMAHCSTQWFSLRRDGQKPLSATSISTKTS